MKKPSLLKSLALLRERAINWGTEVEQLSLRLKEFQEELSVLLQEKQTQHQERKIITLVKNNMPTITTNDDGSYTITVPAPVAPTPVVAPEATEVDIILTDGTTKKFVPAQ